ncbi:Flp pilus assembly complex ATPase component TadA [bacterium]|nr:Flp pilus assembly complex ATPase component TadA [candidate division CSSED10-310 bacterium]
MPNQAPKRLAELLREMGLLSPKQLERALEEQQRTGDSMLDVLRRDVSFRSIWDLLRYPLPFPFGAAKREQLKDVLLQSGAITDEQLTAALAGDDAADEELGAMLVERGIITKNQLVRARREHQRVGQPLWRSLLNLGFVEPAMLTQLIQGQLSKPQESGKDELVMEVLVNTNLITAAQRDEAAVHKQETGKLMVTYLMGKGVISQEKVAEALEQHLQIPFAELTTQTIDANVVYVLPENFQRTNRVLPVRREDMDLYVAMVNPLDMEVINRINFMTGLTVHPMLCTGNDLDKAHDDYFRRLVESERVVRAGFGERSIEEVAELPAVQLATTIIEGAINARATDIHLEPQLPTMRIRYRIDGRLYDVMSIPESIQQAVFSRIKIMADMDITERRRPQDGHISMRLFGRELNMRIATVPTYLGEKMVIRLFDEANVLRGMRQLGLNDEQEVQLQRLVTQPNGMILVTGPIGSGKTTSLYSFINEINVLENNIVTIEDPVEYRLPGVTQIQVNPVIGLGFASGLRAVLRQDADILMVGEIRDSETARVATWAALTGQLVFCTLHTKNAISAVTMLNNLGVEDFLIASSLLAVVGQRLVRRICPHCATPYRPDEALLASLGLPPAEELTFSRGLGCDQCQQTGYLGRVGVFEIFEPDDAVKKMITAGVASDLITQAAVAGGMRSMWNDGLDKITHHLTTPEEVLREVTLA